MYTDEEDGDRDPKPFCQSFKSPSVRRVEKIKATFNKIEKTEIVFFFFLLFGLKISSTGKIEFL